MTANGAKTCIPCEKSAVEVCPKSAKKLGFQRIGVFFGLSVLRTVEMEPDVMVLLRS